jgi:tetratricopeptide (TPR) repeat protein
VSLLAKWSARQGDLARGRRDWPVAQRRYETALERNPRFAPIWVQLGHALNMQVMRTEALAAYLRADELRPGQADTHHQIARMKVALGDPEGALESYSQALRLDPTLPGARAEATRTYIDFGKSLRDQCRTAEATSVYQRLVGSHPSNTPQELAVDPTAHRFADPLSALNAYSSIFELGPAPESEGERAHRWMVIGHALKDQGAWLEALAAYRHADEMRPDSADTLLHVGRMQRALGADGVARSSYERAVALDPSRGDAIRELAVLMADSQDFSGSPQPGLPLRLKFIGLGTTGTCNASCVHCPTGKPETADAPRMAMPMPLFKKIIDGLAELDLPITDQISFGLFGDGLVDPLVVTRAAYLRSRLPDVRLSVNTNGAAFNRAKHAPLNDTISVMALHCESLDPATYNYLMQPLRFERVFPKYEPILETFPGKVLVSVPISRRNYDERHAIAKWFFDRGAWDVNFDPLSSRCAEDRTVFDSLALDPHPIRCPQSALDDLIVDCDGQVLICCQDFQRLEGIGDLRDDSLEEVLAGVRRYKIRKLFADGAHEQMATCSRCYGDLRE